MASTLLTPSAVSRMAWIRIGFLTRVLGLELRQKLIEIVDVPRSFDLGQHDDVELVADAATISVTSSSTHGELRQLMRVHRPGRAEVVLARHRDEALARRFLLSRPGSRPRDCRARRRPGRRCP